MSDGPSLTLHEKPLQSLHIDLTTFSLWIELQPIGTLAGMLELMGNECYRRNMWTTGNEIKHIVSELRA